MKTLLTGATVGYLWARARQAEQSERHLRRMFKNERAERMVAEARIEMWQREAELRRPLGTIVDWTPPDQRATA